jgi:hypothetical protein
MDQLWRSQCKLFPIPDQVAIVQIRVGHANNATWHILARKLSGHCPKLVGMHCIVVTQELEDDIRLCAHFWRMETIWGVKK